MTLAGIQLFQTLKNRLGERETKALVDYVDTTLKENNKEVHATNLRTLATKEDLWATREGLRKELWATRQELKNDIAKVREELKGDISKTREDLKGDIAKTREELKGDIAKTREEIKDVKSDVIRWMFAFFITMMLAMLGLFLKH